MKTNLIRFAVAFLFVLPIATIAQNAIPNGDFSQGLTGWAQSTISGCGGTSSVNLIASDPPHTGTVEVKKVNAGGCFGAASVEQPLNVPVSTAPLELPAYVKAINASVGAGCGFGGLEFPLAVQLGYLPRSGSQMFVKFAFHLGGGTCGAATTDGPSTAVVQTQLSSNQWHSFNSGSLLNWIPAGSTINRIIIYGNGWDFTGRADNLSLTSNTTNGPWATRMPMPTAGYQVQLATVNGRIYAIGGDLGVFPQDSNHNEEYDPVANDWQPKMPMSNARRAHAVVELGGKIYSIGGVSNSTGNVPLPTVEMYDPATNAPWQNMNPMPQGRQHPAAAAFNGKIYVFAAGTPLGANDTRTLVYDPQRGQWNFQLNTSPIRHILTATTIGDKIYVTGIEQACPNTILDVGNCRASTPQNLFYAYDPASDIFLPRRGMNVPRNFPAAETLNGRLYLIGGNLTPYGSPTETGSTEEYDPLTDQWTTLQDMPTPRYNLGAAKAFGKIYVIGGGASNNQVFETNEEFDPLFGTCVGSGIGTLPVLVQALNGSRVSGASVQVQPGPTLVTSISGDVNFCLAAGIHTAQITANGYQTVSFTATVLNGMSTPVEVTVVPTGVGTTNAVQVPAIADQNFDTGVNVNAGDTIVFTATGIWGYGPVAPGYPLGPDGIRGCNGGPGWTLGFAPPCGGLAARIGNGNWFYVGPSATFTALSTGRLFLSTNDLSGVFWDNVGQVSVTVEAIPAPGGVPGMGTFITESVTGPGCNPFSTGRLDVIWGRFGKRSFLLSDLGQRLELECSQGQFGLGYQLFISPGPCSSGRCRVGACPFEGGCNSIEFVHVGDLDSNGQPDRIISTQWISRDYGWWNDLPNPFTGESQETPGVLDWAIWIYDGTTNYLSKTAIKFQYDYGPPLLGACLGIPSRPEGSEVNRVAVDPPIGPATEVFFENMLFLLQQVPQPNAPMEISTFARCDLNRDGACDHSDLTTFLLSKGYCRGTANFDPHFDANSDGCVTDVDQKVLFGSDPVVIDPDGDSVYGANDNCPFLYNPSQADSDADGIGDACQLNRRPLANAGADQMLEASNSTGGTLALDGSNSLDLDGDALAYSWTGPFGTATGATPTVTLPLGIHTITLTVDDAHGGVASDTVEITVRDTTAPVVTPPANIVIPTTEGAGARGSASATLAAFLASGTASDLVDPSPLRLSAQKNGVDVNNSTLFPLGTTMVTFRFRDASGNTGTATATVTVTDAPVITTITPTSGQRGQYVQLYVSGRFLKPGAKVNLSGSGITVVSTTRISNEFAISLLLISSNASTGPRALTATTSSGTSNAVTFTVQ